MALTDTFLRQAKHNGKPAGDKHSDGGGMYLHITKASRYWRMGPRWARPTTGPSTCPSAAP